MNKEILEKLTSQELLILGAEANSTNDQRFVDEIMDVLKERDKLKERNENGTE